MPFTISHVAAAWPFERSRLILSAVIVGAMAPDFDYFLHVDVTGRSSHNFPGVFEFSLPAALIVLAMFHRLLKRPVVALLPERLQQRIVVREFSFWPLPRLLLILASLLVGIATHLLWDSFTHAEGWVVERVPWCWQRHLILGHDLQHYKIAEHSSSILGLVVVGLWIRWWYLRQEPVADRIPMLSFKLRTSIALLVFLISLGVGVGTALAFAGRDLLSAAFIGIGVVNFVSAAMLELIVFSLVVRTRMESRQSLARSK